MAVLAIVGLFFASNKSGQKAQTHRNSGAQSLEDSPSMPVVEAVKFDSILSAAMLKLSPSDKDLVAKLEDAIPANPTEADAETVEELALFWSNKNRRIAAHYFLEAGKLDNSEKKLNFASHIYFEELHEEFDAPVRQWMINEAKEAFELSLKINPDNEEVRIDYGLLFVDIIGQPMEGIQQLLSVVEKNPDNIPATIILGKMAIESGQLDKAIERGLTVLSLDPDNLEGHLFLGEAYKRHNEIDKAVEVFTKAKSLLDHPEFRRDIDEYIKSFTN